MTAARLTIAGLTTARATRLDRGWTLMLTDAGAFATPQDLPPDAQTCPAIVPGTVAGALRQAGRFDREQPDPLFDKDAWYRLSLAAEAPGPAILGFEGLATLADVFLDGKEILKSDSMFERHEATVTLNPDSVLHICFRALKPLLERKGPRARWRPRLMNQQGLRLTRTTALGFMPGWCPQVHAAGPWRPITLARPIPGSIHDLSILPSWKAGMGQLKVSFRCDMPALDVHLVCAGHETVFARNGSQFSAELDLPGIEPWWPHSHGRPIRHDVSLRAGDESLAIGKTGFRNIEIDKGEDGRDFAIVVNGERVFCRGAVWTSPDIVNLSGDEADYRPWLELAREAGMNMIRIPGIATYESGAFFALCDELGILVWQDVMLANFDYPVADEDLMIHVKSEVEQFLAMTAANPSLAILCGGSEIFQQGAMLGLPESAWKTALCTEILADVTKASRPDMAYVPNTPSGGAQPFFVNCGVAHYYGVGAYRRPIEDARRANLRFAAECLAFSNLGQDEDLAGGKAGIPRDAGADWDFEDSRDHYLQDLYAVEPNALRRSDLPRYLALSRAVTGEVMEAAFAEWRRPGSSCHGALTFTFQDVMAGPGWGVVDADRRPKPAWYALKRAFRPIQLLLSDEGTNGLDLHLLNETESEIPVVVEIACLRDGRMPVVSGRREMKLSGRISATIAATDLFGAFFDTTYAYRFGPPSHDVTVARLKHGQSGEILAEAFHFPLGRAAAMHDADIEAVLEKDADGIWLSLSTDKMAQSVTIDAPGFRASDNGFHLAPGAVRRIRLTPLEDAPALPQGPIRFLGNGRILTIQLPEASHRH